MDKRLRLVRGLLERTQNGVLEWEVTERDGVFQVSFPSYSLRISEDGADIRITIYSGDGILVEQFTDEDLEDLPGATGMYSTMSQLYVAARRIAMGAERALDAILDQIGASGEDETG